MYEIINLLGVDIYTFGLTLTVCFFLFVWMLKKISGRFGINFSYFTNRALWLLISTFFFSRLFYIIAYWEEFSSGFSLRHFFFMKDYDFSLLGALFGFLLVVFITTRVHRIKSGKYLDAIVLSFLFVSIVGYIGAFLGGQIYGGITNFGIEVSYFTSNIPFQKPIFPLAIFYSVSSFIIFLLLYMFANITRIRGIAGFLGLIALGATTIALEFFSGKYDYFKQNTVNLIDGGINFNQIFAIFFILVGFYGLGRIAFSGNKERDLIF